MDPPDELRLADVPRLGRIAELQAGREQHRAHGAVGDDHRIRIDQREPGLGLGAIVDGAARGDVRERRPDRPVPGRSMCSGVRVGVSRARGYQPASGGPPRLGTMAAMADLILSGERVVLRPARPGRHRAAPRDPARSRPSPAGGIRRRPKASPRRGWSTRRTTRSSPSNSTARSSAASSTPRRPIRTTATPAIDLFLTTDVQGQGIGPDAIRTVARYLIDVRGHHRLTIDPSAANERAIHAYSKLGFRPVGVQRAVRARPGRHVPRRPAHGPAGRRAALRPMTYGRWNQGSLPTR